MQEWRPIPGFPHYEASDDGSIRAASPRYRTGRGSGPLRPWVVERHGRRAAYVTLHADGKRFKFLVHRLVCLAFHGEPPEGMTDCAHVNHNALDNRAANLRWSTHADNVAENFSEAYVEARMRLDDSIGWTPNYLGPDRGMPF